MKKYSEMTNEEKDAWAQEEHARRMKEIRAIQFSNQKKILEGTWRQRCAQFGITIKEEKEILERASYCKRLVSVKKLGEIYNFPPNKSNLIFYLFCFIWRDSPSE
ncbi:MAG TPA: hypothetical protein PLF59_08080 [Cyclobacteriaceae bacterium]|nr:hypothetical protein [Cyclobacteriaceae bacterium]